MCLFAPPGAIISVLPLIHNLMVKHPTCIKLIHLDGSIPTEYMPGMNDPFDPEEKDPEKTHAIDSYLWELLPLKKHALSSVSEMARLFDQPLGKSNYELEDFLDLTYDTIFVEESKTKNKAHGQQLYKFSESMY
jgi:U3 small nucleolar RNA-associated protein 19